ncbi:MAG TPA: alkaline phosphatase family protein [Candidatus Saccharimonadales bacterium]|nr:alkaline phosphatase family protein [Candidatus Saccharimonadales bacterium]
MRIKERRLSTYVVLGVVCFITFLYICIIFFYHRTTDKDIASFLLKAPLSNIQVETQSVTALSKIHHVFVIVEENHNWQEIYKNPDAPFINKTLLPISAYAQQYYTISKNDKALHPSEPNYILLESGMIAFPDHTFTTDKVPSASNSTNSHNHIAYLLEQKKLSWKSYQEDISGKDCPINTVNNYVPRHNPFVFFQDVAGNPPNSMNIYCQKHIRPVNELQKDLQTGTVANYVFITPNLQHDMHDGTITQADTRLSTIVPLITQSATFQKDGALIVLWDEGKEGDDENSPIGMIVTSPFVKKGYANTITYSHASFVKTIEEIFQISPLLGIAAYDNVQDLSDFFQP